MLGAMLPAKAGAQWNISIVNSDFVSAFNYPDFLFNNILLAGFGKDYIVSANSWIWSYWSTENYGWNVFDWWFQLITKETAGLWVNNWIFWTSNKLTLNLQNNWTINSEIRLISKEILKAWKIIWKNIKHQAIFGLQASGNSPTMNISNFELTFYLAWTGWRLQEIWYMQFLWWSEWSYTINNPGDFNLKSMSKFKEISSSGYTTQAWDRIAIKINMTFNQTTSNSRGKAYYYPWVPGSPQSIENIDSFRPFQISIE